VGDGVGNSPFKPGVGFADDDGDGEPEVPEHAEIDSDAHR
jgi:hypothetical protein